jgi:2-polyprenyl-3-methyl-5-hydroxy-6-metoxy-1,4-benzoquinol methylase
MERIPEPELMTDPAQAKAYAHADFAEPHQRFINCLQETLPHLGAQGIALDLGCGPGDITLRFAWAFPGWQVDGLDGSPAMLHHGQMAVAQAGLNDRVTFAEVYLPDGEAPRSQYDLIFSNSLLHHLADPIVLWQAIQRWAKPNADIFVMDLLRPASPALAAQLVGQYAANEPEILRRDFYHSLCAAYQLDEVVAQLQQANLSHLRCKIISDRHWILWGKMA